MSNNHDDLAVRLKVPFATPFTDREWFEDLPIPSHWDYVDWSAFQDEVGVIEYLIHPLKGFSYSHQTPDIVWPIENQEYLGQVDITDNEISEEFIHPRFLRWLDDLGLQISSWDIFITPPYMSLRAHKDTQEQTVKLNFAYMFEDGLSQQNYFKPLEDAQLIDAPSDDIDVRSVLFGGEGNYGGELIHEHNVANDWTMPSLTNVGRWHNVVNKSPGTRICLSYQLKLKKDKNVSLWQDVYPILKEFVVE